MSAASICLSVPSQSAAVLVAGGSPAPLVEGGDQPPKVTTGPRDSLSFDKVIEIVINCEGLTSDVRAKSPKAGEVYVYDTNVIGADWKADDYVIGIMVPQNCQAKILF